MEASRTKGNGSTQGGSPSRLAGAANGKTTPVRAKSPPATTLDPLPTPNGKANNNKQRKSSGEPGKCELHDIAECEWCALGVKNRSMYGRLWPYAEHPVTREHYCLEPVESPTGGKYPCCSFRREKPIKTSQGYAGHLASHRAHIQGSTNTINGVGVAPLPLLVAMSNGGGSGGGSAAASPLSNGDQALGKKRKRESTLTGSHETVATPTMSAVSTTSSSGGGGGGGKVMPQFVASLQPSLPRCDLEAGQLRFILLPQDSEAAAIDVVFKGHRGKLNKRAAKDADGFFVIACPLIHELLPPNDTRTTFEVSVRVEDPATHRRLFQSSLLFTHHHAAAQASAPARAESVVAGGSAPRPPARASANGDEDYDEAEEGEEEEKEEEREEEMMTNKEEDEEGGERAGEERETKNEDEKTKKEKRRKIEEEKSGGEETPEEKAEEKMETAGVEGEEAGEASESQAMELEIAEENEDDDDDDEEENDAEANVKKNEGEADGEDQKERSRFEVIGEADDNDQKVATQQGAELRPNVAIKIEAMGETIADEKVDHQQKPQRELPDLLTQLAEVAAAESHNNFAPAAARPAPSSGKANGHGAAVERPTMAEALHAMPMNTVSSLLPWAHMAAAAAGGHPLPPHFALPDCYALTPAAAAAAAAAIAADPHTAALMLPGLFQSYYGPGGPLPLSALLPPMPHASQLPLPPTTRPLASIPASMMTAASQSSSAMSTSSSTSAISPALTAMIKAKAPSSPPTSTSTTTTITSGGAPATAAPTTPTTPTTTSTATPATAQKPWLRGQLAPMAQMMTSIPPPKPPKPAKPAKPPKVVKPVVKHTLPPSFVLQPAGSGPKTPPTAATAGTAASTSASSAPSPIVAVAPASRPLQTLAARPSCATTAGRETCRYYFYTVLPEKGKLIWVVFFSRRRHALDQYEVLLHEVAPPLSASSGSLSSSIERLACSSSSSGGGGGGGGLSLSSSASALAMAMTTELEPDAGDSPSPSPASTSQPPPLSPPPLPELPTSGGPGQQTIVLPAVPDLAWIAEWTDSKTGQRLYQHKVCFQAPDSTFERRIFCATLHQRVERTMTLLGGLSLVSTTSQREQMWSRINQWFVGEVQQRLVHNCRYHPPSRRHFLNGKGSRQGSKQAQKDRFLFDELDKSVELESVPVNSLLPGT